MLVIALIHALRLGSYLDGVFFTIYYSYFSDFIIPFGMYFLLCINDSTIPFLTDWRLKALLVFAVSTLTEVMQAFGIYFLGVTFDPVDIVMFGGGVLIAAFVDRVLFWHYLPFWRTNAQ